MRKWALIIVLLSMFAFVAALGDPADAAEVRARTVPCSSQMVNKAMPWGYDTTYTYPIPPFPAKYRTKHIRIVGTLVYAYCPNNNRAEKVMPLNWTFCHLHLDTHAGWPFDGVKFAPYIADDAHALDMARTKVVAGDDAEQVCGIVYYDEYEWFQTRKSAAVTITAWVVLKKMPDQDVTMFWGDSHVRYFRPLEDMNVSGWYGP